MSFFASAALVPPLSAILLHSMASLLPSSNIICTLRIASAVIGVEAEGRPSRV